MLSISTLVPAKKPKPIDSTQSEEATLTAGLYTKVLVGASCKACEAIESRQLGSESENFRD